VFVAGGWQHRTRPRFADAIRAAATTKDGEATLTRGENFVVAAIAYLQPVTRAELTGLAGREIGCDVLARLKQLGLIAAGPRTEVDPGFGTTG
jgi:chromosome segregation and condensation protein ScpB